MRFSRLILLLCAVCVAFSLVSCNAKPGEPPLGMTAAAPDYADYDLFVPETWTVTMSGGAVAAYKSAMDPTSVSVTSFGMANTDSTVEDWWNGYESEFLRAFSSFTVESTETTLLGGAEATKFVYTGTLGENTYRYTQYAVAKSGVLYLLTFTEHENTETDHAEDFSAIVENFAFRE